MKTQIITKVTPIVEFVRSIPGLNLEFGPWVAGGAARRIYEGQNELGSGDIDIFYPSYDIREACNKLLFHRFYNSTVGKFACVSSNNNQKIVIHNNTKPIAMHSVASSYFQDVTKLLDSFDFNVCQFATDGYQICYTEQAKDGCDSRKIQLTTKKPKRTSTARLLKYMNYGFKIDEQHLLWSLNLDHSKCNDQGMIVELVCDGDY